MKSSFEQQLKQQLEQSSAEALGFKPDRERMWNRIEAKQKRKTLPLRLWLSHAAAIAAGLVIGSFFLARYHEDAGPAGGKPTLPTVVAGSNTQQAAPIVTPGLQQPAGLQQNTVSQSSQQRSTTAAVLPAATHKSTLPTQPATSLPQQPVSSVPVQAPLPEPVLIAKAQPAIKVLHLMDINNENTRAMQQVPEPRTVWAWITPPGGRTSEGTSFSEQVSKQFSKQN